MLCAPREGVNQDWADTRAVPELAGLAFILTGHLCETPQGFPATADEIGIIKGGEEQNRQFRASCTALGWAGLGSPEPGTSLVPAQSSPCGYSCTDLAGSWLVSSSWAAGMSPGGTSSPVRAQIL